MFWNKKESEKGLPDLPPSNTDIPSFRKQNSEIKPITIEVPEKHNLPSFPDSPNERGFSQAAIKDAIEDKEVVNDLPKMPQEIKTVEMDEFSPKKFSPPTIKQVQIEPLTQKKSKNTDIFIQIDKFYSGKNALKSIKNRVNEIDSTLKKIRETRMHEEQALSNWEKEITDVKSKISELNDTLFDKVE